MGPYGCVMDGTHKHPNEDSAIIPDKTPEDMSEKDLDEALEDTVPASDPLPASGTISPKSEPEGGKPEKE